MTQKPARTPPSNDAAEAFEDLRKAISMQRSAIEGLTAAKDKLPDYSNTLRDLASRLGQIEKQVQSINERPAMRLTPLTLAAEIYEGTTVCRAEDRKTIGEARESLARSLGQIEGMIKQRRSNDEQDWWVTWAATGGLLVGMFVALIGIATLS